MSDALKTRFEAEIAEHQKTHDRLRQTERENIYLRSELAESQKQHFVAVRLLHGLSDKILKAYPREVSE